MNGAQGGPGHSGAESKAEDIDGILGRFQDWSKARRDPASANFGPGLGRDAEPRKANLSAGTRELSYEQALRASSYRRPPPPPFPPPSFETEPLPQTPAPTAPPTAAPDVEMKPRPAVAKPDGMSAEKTGGRANRGKLKSVGSAGATLRAGNSAAAKPAPSRAATAISDPGAAAPQPVSHSGPQSGPQSGSKTGPAKTSARSSRRRQSTQTVRPASATAAVRAQILASPVEPPRAPIPTVPPSRPAPASAPAPRLPRPQPAFREVFQGTTELIAAPKPEPLLDTKSIALSLRVSDAEQARIQACAARANLSVSAYLRQCALGVDVLRDQVELALVALQKQEVQPARPPGLSAIPGILGRFATQWFRRRRERAEPSGSSLR